MKNKQKRRATGGERTRRIMENQIVQMFMMCILLAWFLSTSSGHNLIKIVEGVILWFAAEVSLVVVSVETLLSDFGIATVSFLTVLLYGPEALAITHASMDVGK